MILLVNPPCPPGHVSNKDTMAGLGELYGPNTPVRLPPLDLFYAAAILRERQVPVRVFDGLVEPGHLPSLLRLLDESPPSLIALRVSLPSIDWDLTVAGILRARHATPMLLFGPYAALAAEALLASPAVDGVATSETEAVFRLLDPLRPQSSRGLWWRVGEEIRRNPPLDRIADLDSLPRPAWEMAPYRAYYLDEYLRRRRPALPVLASRGCPFGCSYCPYPVTQGNRWRARSIENVMAEIDHLVSDLGVQALLFRDPEFTMSRGRALALCRALAGRHPGLIWRAETRPDTLDDELVAAMAAAGCIGVNLGIESASPEVLAAVHRRPLSERRLQQVLAACRRHDLDAYGFFLLGLPGETADSARATIRLALRCKPRFVQFNLLTPFPGTPLSNSSTLEGPPEVIGTTNAARSSELGADELRRLQQLAHRTWEMRPGATTRRIRGHLAAAAGEARGWFRFRMETGVVARTPPRPPHSVTEGLA